ncbi:MAG: DUF1801 domain-containing protein [Ferruginibacter sp.]
MQSTAISVQAYITELPSERNEAIQKLREVIKKNLPKGFKEEMSYGNIGYVVPHTLFPAGYHCDPKLPLPFMAIASQKNFIAIYHMGIYCDPQLLDWFTQAYAQTTTTKLDMGKSCIRFKKPTQIPFELIGELSSKMTVQLWIDFYQKNLQKNRI